MDLIRRPRRIRRSAVIRELVQENSLSVSQLIFPQFVVEGVGKKEAIASMPNIFRLSADLLLMEIERLSKIGIKAFAIFPVVPNKKKDELGSEALNPDGLIPKTVESIKKNFPDLCIITDIALDPYTSHGHDGVLGRHGLVDNDKTVDILTKMALLHAAAGVDMVAPSDMMDGRVGAIRKALDGSGFDDVIIHSYAAKYASSLYFPFREAIGSGLRSGDKRSYQLNPANCRDALLEASLDEGEGADIIMVKPATFYLDIISRIRARTTLPISAYHVSGEYSMVMAAAQNGWLNSDQVFYENILSIKRAGADMIFTYAAPRLAKMIAEKEFC